MFRSMLIIFLVLGSGALASDADVKSIQAALNKLGYNVGKADGISGKKTRAAVARFTQDEGIDGNTDDLQIILENRVSELPDIILDLSVYNKSPFVNYGYNYEKIQDWFDYQAYRTAYNSYYDGMGLGFGSEIPLPRHCKHFLEDPLVFQNFDGQLDKDWKLPPPRAAMDCLKNLQSNINQEAVEQGALSPSLNYYFNTLVPIWTDPKLELKENSKVKSLREWFYDKFFDLYLTYDTLVGTTNEDDLAMVNLMERMKVSLRPSILDTTVAEGCTENAVNIAIAMQGTKTAKNFSEWNNIAACGDETAERAEILAHLGASFGISDYIDESVHRIRAILLTATKEGYTKQTLRFDEASGYMLQLAQRIERTAHIILMSTGRNIYDEDLAGNGVTVRTVLQAAVDAYLDPPSIKHVAELVGRSERVAYGITKIHPPSHWPQQHDNFWADLRRIEAGGLQEMATFFPKSRNKYSKWLYNKTAYRANALDWAVVREMHNEISASLGKF